VGVDALEPTLFFIATGQGGTPHPVFIVGMLTFMAVVGAVVDWIRYRKFEEAWVEAAMTLGLDSRCRFTFGNIHLRYHLSGTIDGFEVTVRGGDGFFFFPVGLYTRVTVTLPGQGPKFRLACEGLTVKLGKALSGSDDIQTGDPDFDDKVLVQGDERSARAVLSHRARDAASTVIRRNGRVEEGQISCGVEGGVAKHAYKITSYVNDAMKLARFMGVEEPLAPALARNARKDPIGAVRRACFRMLLREEGAGKLKTKTAREALSDLDGDLRTLAADYLGVEVDPPPQGGELSLGIETGQLSMHDDPRSEPDE